MDIIREKILKILKIPCSVSDLKEKIPEVSSFGTISYHLKVLEKEGKIKKKKMKDKRGQPTYYSLKEIKAPKTQEEMIKWLGENKLKYKIKVLKLLKEKPRDDIFFAEDEDLEDVVFDLSNEGLSKFTHSITPKGEKFLKENEKKK